VITSRAGLDVAPPAGIAGSREWKGRCYAGPVRTYRACSLLCLLLVACGEVKSDGDPDAATIDGGSQPDADLTVPQRLTVAVSGPGRVASDPAGIDCGETCAADFAPGSSVTLTPTADPAALFDGWSGDCAGTGPCTLTMDGAKSAQARFATHGGVRWVGHVSYEGQESADDIVVDGDGNVIAFGIAQVSGDAGFDLYVVKYAKADGAILWSKLITTTSGEYAGGLAVDAANNVYVAGTIYGSNTPTMIGTTTVTPDLFGNIVVVKLAAASGDVQWVQQWGGDGQDRPQGLAVAGEDLYVVGESSSTSAAFGSILLAMSTGDSFVLRARTSDGVPVRAKALDGNVDRRGVAAGGGHVLVGGDFRGTLLTGGCSNLTSSSGASSDGVVIDFLGTTLDCQWAKKFGDATNNDSAAAVAAYPGGGWVVTGSFQGNVLFAESGSSLVSRGGFDAFAVRYEANGTHVWSFRYGDTGFDLGTGVAVTPDGAVILAGGYAATIQFGAITLTGASNVYVTRMSADRVPSHEWAVGLGGDSSDGADEVAVDADGTVSVLASFTGMTVVGGTSLTAQNYDLWIASLVR
jgi:hypothetical protein